MPALNNSHGDVAVFVHGYLPVMGPSPDETLVIRPEFSAH